MDKELKIAFDFDGVVASPILDGLLINLRIIKEHLMKSIGHRTDYFYPKSREERFVWTLLNKLRKPTCDLNCLRSLKSGGGIQTFLITSRFKFLEKDTIEWLKKYGLENLFDKIYINNTDISPVDFKVLTLNENLIDHYLDDDIEIIESINLKVKTKIYWRSNKKHHHSEIVSCKSICEFIEEIKKLEFSALWKL